MVSPFSFFILVMSTLFFADLIPGMFFTPLKSSSILWMSCCLFILFCLWYIFMHLLTSFRRCFSSLGVLLLSSMSLRISTSYFEISSSLFCCWCLTCFFTVFFFLAHVVADTWHDRTCLFVRMWASCVMLFTHDVTWLLVHRAEFRMFFTCLSCCLHGDIQRGFCGRAFNSFCFCFCFLIFDHDIGLYSIRIRDVMHRFRSFARVVVHVVFDMLGVKHDVTRVFVRRVKSRMSRMSSTCFSCRLHAVIHHGSCAPSFDIFCPRFSIFTFCFRCCCVPIFCLRFCIFIFCLRCCFFRGGGIFDFFDDLLVSFFELRLLNFDVFSVWSLPSCFLYRVFLLSSCNGYSFQAWWSWKLPWHICGHFPCGSCRWLRRLCCISSIFSWLICSRFVSRCLLEIWRSFVSEVFFCTSCWVLCILVTSANVSSNHSFCFPRWVFPTLMHSVPWPGPSSALKSPPTIGMYLLQFVVCFSIVLYIFQCDGPHIPSGWKYTLISLMRWRFTTIVAVMARSLMYSLSIILCLHFLFSIGFQHRGLLSYFPAPMNVCLWCVSQISDLSCLHVSLNDIASHL